MFVNLIGKDGVELESLSLELRHTELILSDSTDPYTKISKLRVLCTAGTMSSQNIRSVVLEFRDAGELERLEVAIANLRRSQTVWKSSEASSEVSRLIQTVQPEHRTHGHIAENDDDYDSNDPRRRGA